MSATGCFFWQSLDGSPGKNREDHWFPNVLYSCRVCLKCIIPGPFPDG